MAWVLAKWNKLIGEESESSKNGGSSVQDETAADEERKKRAKIAAARRAQIMANMKKAQSSFMQENSKLFEETPSGNEKRRLESVSNDVEMAGGKCGIFY